MGQLWNTELMRDEEEGGVKYATAKGMFSRRVRDWNGAVK